MHIIVSHDKANQIWTMLVKAKGLRKAKRERCGQQGVNPKPILSQSNTMEMKFTWLETLVEHGGISEIQCNYGKEGEGGKKNTPSFSSKGWKHEIRSHKVCGHSLKFVFQNFEKSPWEHYISKNSFNFWNKFLYFQSCNYKIFMKIHHVSRIILYV